VDREHCFAASACPYDAFIHNPLKRTWEVDAKICGDCPGPCLNFCDKDALRWGDDLVDLSLVKAEIEGTMKPEQVAEARLKHKKELADAQEAAKRKSADEILALTRANFEQEVLRSEIPVVLDCWADWCGPCKQFSPIFESLAKQYVGVVKFAKLDTEAEPALARGLGVQALPTVMMFYKGQIANVVEGALPAEHFNAWIYQTLAAIRQYETQFEAEANEMVGSASRNVATLNGSAPQEPEPASGAPEISPGLVIDPNAAIPGDRPPDRQPPGKQTPSGLYIP
jgi:thioredoxin